MNEILDLLKQLKKSIKKTPLPPEGINLVQTLLYEIQLMISDKKEPKSDTQILHDLHKFVYAEWSSVIHDKRRPLPIEIVEKFLHSQLIPPNKIPRLIETAFRAGIIRPGTNPDTFVPRPRI